MHLAARFCAKEAVAKALGLSAWSYREVEVVSGDGPPERAPERPRGGAGGGAGRGGRGVAHAHRGARRRGGAPAVSPLPDWLDPLFEASEMRAVDEWAIDRAGTPSLDLMERAGAGLARVDRGRRGRGARLRGGGQGQQRRRRPGGRAAAAGGRPRGARAGDRVRRTSCAATRPRTSSGFPAIHRRPGIRPAWRARARWWTRCSAPASRASRASPWRARSPRSTHSPRRWWPATCPRG